MSAPKPKFVMLGKSKFVHVARTKAADLKVKNGSPCPQVRKYQVANTIPKKGISPEAASVLEPCEHCNTTAAINALLPAEAKAEAKKAKKDEVMDKFRPEPKKAKARKSESGDKAPKEPRAPRATMVGVRSTGNGQRDKAEALVAFAKESGWQADIGEGLPGLEVKAVREGQTILCWFVDGKYDEARPAQLHVGDWTGKLRGVHMCRRQMAGGDKAPYREPGKGRSGPRKKDADIEVPKDESPEDARRRVPFALDDDDIVIIDAIKGKTIKWRNTMSNSMESAWLPADPKGKKTPKLFIQYHPKTRERMVTFLEVMSIATDDKGRVIEQYGPTRTVRLNKIARVV